MCYNTREIKEKGVIHMKLHFVGGAVGDVEIKKQTKNTQQFYA